MEPDIANSPGRKAPLPTPERNQADQMSSSQVPSAEPAEPAAPLDIAVDDDANQDTNDLSSPPSTLTPVSSSGLQQSGIDEEVPGGGGLGPEKSSPLRVTSDREDEEMVDPEEDPPVVSHYPKRKRVSLGQDRVVAEQAPADSPGAMSDNEGVRSSRSVRPTRAAAAAAAAAVAAAANATSAAAPAAPTLSVTSFKGVVMGHWRDSTVPEREGGKHAVVGFIDVKDRLRTRIQAHTRTGEPISSKYPIPPGPGGSWVTFEHVVFDRHLVGLNQFQVKEYVRLRLESPAVNDTPEEREQADNAAVIEAIRRVEANPPAEHTNGNSPIAYGHEIPAGANTARGPELKRRRTSGGFASINSIASTAQTPTQQQQQRQVSPQPPASASALSSQAITSNPAATPTAAMTPTAMTPTSAATSTAAAAANNLGLEGPSTTSALARLVSDTLHPGVPSNRPPALQNLDPLYGTRPTRILLGCWKGSSEANPANKHAVYGILGNNDMFRVKLVRNTRDGRYVDGNFPPGPGALWIHYDEVDFEPHLKDLNRNEVKEYCRVRQRQIDLGEKESDRIDNETKAVYEAQARVARQSKLTMQANGHAYQPALAPAVSAPAAGSRPGPAVPALDGSDVQQDMTMRTTLDLPPAAHSSSTATPTTTQGGSGGAGRPEYGGHDLRQTRHSISRADHRPARHSLPEEPLRHQHQHQHQHQSQPHQLQLQQHQHGQLQHHQAGQQQHGQHHQHHQHGQQQHGSQTPHGTRAAPMDLPGPGREFDREAMERTTNIARREINRMEAVQNRTDQRIANREAANAAAAHAAANAANAAATNAALTMGITPPGHHHSPKGGPGLSQPPQQQPPPQQQQVQQQPQTQAQAQPQQPAGAAQAAAAPQQHQQTQQHQHQHQQQSQPSQQPQQQQPGSANRMRFNETDEMQRLNKIWAKQEANRLRVGAEDGKIHNGVKYERKTTGPFMGKLVSQGTIINIDGEDYVEYRVLTKPSFF